ncbi:hypothetical protein JCM13304A_23500 [Desulfothermus okinawensis JCM 13304]
MIQQGYKLIKGRDGLGTGDIKLMFLIGGLLGAPAIPFVIFIGSILGLFGGLYYLKLQNSDTQNPIPFGPFLCLAACLYILCGKEFILWYLGFLTN